MLTLLQWLYRFEWGRRGQRWLLARLRRERTYRLEDDGGFGNALQQAWFEALGGRRIRPWRPHEFAPVLVLRPFGAAQWRQEIPRILDSGFVPGFRFIGLDRAGARVTKRSVRTSRILWTLGTTVLALLGLVLGSWPWFLSVMIGAYVVLGALGGLLQIVARVLYARACAIRSDTELEAAVHRLRTTTHTQLFFNAPDAIWQHAVERLSDAAAVVLIDVSEATAGVEWELLAIGARHPHKIVAYLIDQREVPASLIELLPPDAKVHRWSTLTSSIGEQIFPSVVHTRRRFDCQASRRALRQALAAVEWSREYWQGLDRMMAHEFADAVPLLTSAWDHAVRGSEPAWCVYPGLALAGAFEQLSAPTLAGPQAVTRRTHDVLAAVCAALTGSSTADADARPDDELLESILDHDSPRLPVAPWQYEVMLSESISILIRLRSSFRAAIAAASTDDVRQFAHHEELREALEGAKSMLERATSRQDVHLQAMACLFLAEIALRLGTWDEARAYADHGERLVGDDDVYLAEALRFLKGLAPRGTDSDDTCPQ